MEYTPTRIDTDGPRYPQEQREPVRDPMEDQMHRSIFLGKARRHVERHR